MRISRSSFSTLFDKINHMIYLIGGQTGNYEETVNLCDSYHFPTKTWKALPPMLYPRANPGCMLINDTIWVMGGFKFDSYYRIIHTFEKHVIGTDYWEEFGLIPELYKVFLR